MTRKRSKRVKKVQKSASTREGSHDELEELRLLDAEEVAGLLGVSKRYLYKLVEDGNAPEPIRMGTKLLKWSRSSVATWIERGGKN